MVFKTPIRSGSYDEMVMTTVCRQRHQLTTGLKHYEENNQRFIAISHVPW